MTALALLVLVALAVVTVWAYRTRWDQTAQHRRDIRSIEHRRHR